jgi:hypothetical protein
MNNSEILAIKVTIGLGALCLYLLLEPTLYTWGL